MSITFTAVVTGLKQIRKTLEKSTKAYRNAMGAALYQEGLIIMAASKREVPVKFGFLRGSGYVAPPTMADGGPIVELGYGKSYAPEVHEIPRTHAVGKDHFLSDPIKRARAGYTRRIQSRTNSNLKRGIQIGGVARTQPTRPSEGRKETG